jgi:hypothetical protein
LSGSLAETFEKPACRKSQKYTGKFLERKPLKFNVITSFQISYVMPGLAEKLRRELKSGSRIVSNTWKFPNWEPEKQEGSIRLYKI